MLILFLAALSALLILAVPFPITPEPEAINPKAVYDGFDTSIGIIATRYGVVGADSKSIFYINETGLVKKSFTLKPLSLKALVLDDGVGLAVFASSNTLRLFEIKQDAGDFNLVLRCEARIKDELISSTKIASGGLVGFKTKSGGLLLSTRNCGLKRLEGNFDLGLSMDDVSGIPFVLNDLIYLARDKNGGIEVTELNISKKPCDKPVLKDGYAAIPLDGELKVIVPSSGSAKSVARNLCGKSDEILISSEIDALFLPIENGYSLYRLSSAVKRWDHIIPGSARLLGLFGQDLFWAFSFERDGKNYVNLFRFRNKNAQLYGRYPLESLSSGRFAWSDKGFVALELDGRIVVYESTEIKPLLVVKLDAPLVDLVSHNEAFYALDSKGKLWVVLAKRP